MGNRPPLAVPLLEDAAVRQWAGYAYRCVSDLYLPGAELEDLRQEALIGLLAALRTFDTAADTPLRAWVRFCVRRKVMSAVTMARAEKHRPLSDAVREAVTDDGAVCEAVELLPSPVDVGELVEQRDTLRRMVAAVPSLTVMERAELAAVANGGAFWQAGVRNKRRENAVQRARTKLRAAA